MAITYHAGRRLQGTNDPSANYGTKSIDGSYTVLQFTESGVFTPTSAFDVDYLVVGGGGGAGQMGGGAGGMLSSLTASGGGSIQSKLSVSAGNYAITVGAGGTAGGFTTIGGQGNNSSISTNVIALGGGYGGYGAATGSTAESADGGSGGGAQGGSWYPNPSVNYGAGTTNQGYHGGQATYGSDNYTSGGSGGGAGGIGGNAFTSTSASSYGGLGGVGVQNSISGTATWYAAGGGGGTEGSVSSGWVAVNGIGGKGKYSGGTETAGVANSGSGGGGTLNSTGVGAGGSGIVILRFLTSDAIFHPSTSQVGSRFEETDTRKMYHRDDVDFKEEGTLPVNYRSASWYEQLSGETP